MHKIFKSNTIIKYIYKYNIKYVRKNNINIRSNIKHFKYRLKYYKQQEAKNIKNNKFEIS